MADSELSLQMWLILESSALTTFNDAADVAGGAATTMTTKE
jgi:hypothetical protein